MPLSPLEHRLSTLLDKRKAQSKLRVLKPSPPGSVDFSSNDFLSLATNKEFQDDYLALLNKCRTPLGSTGSRLLDGNSDLAESLESEIATFHRAEAGLLTNSGFDANVSIFGFLPQPEDIIVYDELIHASVHDGMRQSRAKKQISFKHNDLEDLRLVLHQLSPSDSKQTIFLAVETVYSMEGDVAPLTEMVDLLEAMFPGGNAHLIVDEAHATGIYGPNGSGRVCELGLEKRISIRLITFGKAMASNGAIILCSPVIRLYLVNYARPLIYTTFMSYSNLLAIKTAYHWLARGKTNMLASHLYDLIDCFYEALTSLSDLASRAADANGKSLVTLPASCPESPIFAILSPHPRALAAHCQAAGFVVRPVVSPTVPAGTERVRVCLHAGNTIEQIERFVDCVKQWVVTECSTGALSSMPASGVELSGTMAKHQIPSKL